MANRSIFEIEIHPLVQAGIILGAIAIITLLGLASEALGISKEEPIFPWIISVTMLLFFAIFNSVLGIAYKDQGKYALMSMLAFIVVAVLGGGLAWLISGVSLNDAKSIKWIYVVFSVGYILFFTMVRTMRRIVSIAQKQDARLRGE